MDHVIIAAVTGLITAVITWIIAKTDVGKKNHLLEAQLRTSNEEIRKLGAELNTAKGDVTRLSDFESKYLSVKKNLEQSSVVRDFYQPVILAGPRSVGKSSLIEQWHAPWDHARLDPTQTHKTTTVPIYDYDQLQAEKHFADPDILTKVHVHLKLLVHDFPGELSAQRKMIERAKEDTVQFRRSTGKNLGIVLICMFDAKEAATGLKDSTLAYYNGEMFSNLRTLVSHNEITIERLIFIFNKRDLLGAICPGLDDDALLEKCLGGYQPIIRLLTGVCNPERACEVFTILSREDMVRNNRGAPIVLGEAARRYVETMAGSKAVESIIKEKASNFSAPYLT